LRQRRHGLILDGRNRYRARQHAGIEPRFEEWSGGNLITFALPLNLHRQHLTVGELAAIAVEAKARFEEEARETQPAPHPGPAAVRRWRHAHPRGAGVLVRAAGVPWGCAGGHHRKWRAW